MAEYDKSKYYWIKLSVNFMTSDTVDFLMSQENGAEYVVLYQMLCLKTINNDGELSRQLGDVIIPFDEKKIMRDCKWFSIDTVRIALSLYQRLGLIYQQDNGMLRIANYDNIVGYTTVGAQKKVEQRQRQRTGGQIGGQKVDNCPPEIRYKEIDNSPPIIPPLREEGQVNEDKKRFISEVAGRSQGKYDDSKVDYSLLLKAEKYCKRLATSYSMKAIVSSYDDIIAGKWQTEDERRTEYADKNAERERVLATRRNRAETIADDNVRKVMNDHDYKKIHQQICTVERELAKSTTYDPEREEWLGKLKKKRDERLSFLGYTYADLFPKYECAKCNDTGFMANGKKCDCI